MQITPIAPQISSAVADPVRRTGTAGTAPGAGAAGASGPAFGAALDNALRAVSATQHQASNLAEAFLADPGGAGLEQTMVAMQRAQIGFSSALHVRNRLVAAYTDIMNMQV